MTNASRTVLRYGTIVLVCWLVSLPCFSQGGANYETYVTESNGGLCNETLLLYNDNTFFSERGCEASSHVTFGTWKQKKDTIKFYPADNRKFVLVKKVDSSKTDDNYLHVRIFDSNGKNVTAILLVGQDVPNLGIYPMALDSTGKARRDFKRNGGGIICRSFHSIFRQNIRVPTGSFNNFDITLTISHEWLFRPGSDWGGYGNFELLKHNNTLLSKYPEQFENGKMVRAVFTKQ